MFAQLQQTAWEFHDKARERYRKLGVVGKSLVWVWVGLHVVLIGVFWRYGEAISAYFADLATKTRELSGGWAILSLIIVITSLPPLIGYGTAQMLVGFAYGVSPGFYIASASCLAGGAFAFFVIRRLSHLFSPYIKRNRTFGALSKAVRVKGLPLIIMIRLCPFPYPYSNLFFASIETVTFAEFMIATLATTPKLLLHVFVGHRTYLFADPETRKLMDPTARWVNGIFAVGGSLLGFATSWYLYKLTMQYVAETNGGGSDGDEVEGATDLETGLLGEVDEFLGEDEEDDGEGGRRERGEGPGKGKGAVRLSEDERWDGNFSDFGDEPSQSQGRKSVEVAKGDGGGRRDSRRDSVAWGLGDVDEEEDEAGGEELIALEETKAKRDRRVD